MPERKILFINSHKLEDFQTCPYKYNLYHIEGLEPRAETRLGLVKGTVWHGMMRVWNQGIIKGRDKFELHAECLDWFWDNHPAIISSEEAHLIAQRFTDYRVKYQADNYTPIAAEKGFSKLLYEDAYCQVIYEGTIDLLLRMKDGTLAWLDYKTQHPGFSRDQYHYSNQFLGYTWAVGNSHGFIDYTTWSKTITNKTLRRSLVSMSPERIETWKELAINWALDIIRTHIQGYFIPNYSACDTKYGFCKYTPICTAEKAIVKMVKEHEFQVVEPYRSW